MKKGIILMFAICCVLAALFLWQGPIKANAPQNDSPASWASQNSSQNVFLPSISNLPAEAASATLPGCTRYVNSAASVDGSGTLTSPYKTLTGHTSLGAGITLCLRGTTSGSPRYYYAPLTYLSGNGTSTLQITSMAYPGEHVILQSTGQGVLDVRGDYWQILNLAIDNAGASGPAVVVRNRFDVLRGNDIRNGRYNGIDVRGMDALIDSNQIHNFDSQVAGSDAQCVNLLPTGDRLILRGNTIHDCSGDGIQAFNPNDTPATNVPEDVQIINNVFYRGSISYSENAIDVKIGDRFTITGNDVSGYGYEPIQIQAGGNPSVLFHRYAKNVLFANNKVHEATKGINIHADQNETPYGITVENNLWYNLTGSLAVHGYGIQVVTANNTVIVNNTLAHVAGAALSVVGMSGGTLENNLVYASGASIFDQVSNGAVGHNGYYSAGVTGSMGSNNTTGTSPAFVNSSTNFHLTSGSTAINKGLALGLPLDFDGVTRLGAPDLGAFEYNP